jgi:hypothetical protein
MKMKQFTLGLATAGLMAVGSAASAAVLSLLDDGNVATQVNLQNNDLGLGLNGTDIHKITGDVKSALNGLQLTGGPAKLTFEYLGFEASNKNFSAATGGGIFTNGVNTVGDTVSFSPVNDGLVDFSFGTTSPVGSIGEIFNDGAANPASSNYAIGYVKISDTEWLVLFDDIAAGDRDFDDMGMRITVEAVPVPAGILLMGTALAGFGVMRRRKQAA